MPETQWSPYAADLVASGTLSAAQATLASATATIPNSCVVLPLVGGQGSFGLTLTGTITTSTITLDGSHDPAPATTNWVALPFTQLGQNAQLTTLTLASASVDLQGGCAAFAQIRVRLSAKAGSDSLTVALRASNATLGGGGGGTVTGTVTANAGTNLNTSALALESGGHLAALDTKLPAQGQAVAGSSLPVVLPAAQITTLTPPTAVTANIGTVSTLSQDGTDSTDANATQATAGVGIRGWLSTLVSLFKAGTAKVTLQGTSAVSGTVTANAGTGSFTVAQATGTNLHAVLDANTAKIGTVTTDLTTPGTSNAVASHTNAYRNGGVLHRSAVTATDKLAAIGTVTLSAGAATGSLVNATTYYVAAAPYNRWGSGGAGTIVSFAATATQSIRAAFAQVTGADGYDLFLSTSSTGPLWVGRVTETQRAAGAAITAVGTVGAGGAAGAIDINVVGTGLASNLNPFLVNNAYTPATPTAVNCAGYSIAHLHVKLAVTDLRSAPALRLIPFLQDQTSTGDWFAGAPQALGLLSSAGQPLEQDMAIQIDGSTNMVILIDSISGSGAACSIWVELC